MSKTILFILFLVLSLTKLKAQTDYDKTGYLSRVYVREHATDMPRAFYLLIEADGTMTPITFGSYSTQNTGALSTWNFNPKRYIGKTVAMDFRGTPTNNNNEYPIYDKGNLILLPRVTLTHLNSINEVSANITVPSEFQHPQTDTLAIPHDVLVTPQTYADMSPTATVQLTSYVTGAGTDASPYVSSDGSAGLKQAIAALPNGGTIEIPEGVYYSTATNVNIPRFVSLKGTGTTKPLFKLTQNKSWRLKGSNTLDNISTNSSSINSYYHELIMIDHNARDVVVKNSEFTGAYTVNPSTFQEQGNGVCFRMYSHISNILFHDNVFNDLMRGIVTKGQRNQHDITIRNNTFNGPNHWNISFDQTSNISNILVENNQFLEFSHFSVAFARITNVIIRGNTFYSRSKLGFNTFNHAIHIEEHCQNFLIENNHVDTLLRHSQSSNPNTTLRNPAIWIADSRLIDIENNTILNSDILLTGTYSDLDEKLTIADNEIDNGGIQLREAWKRVTVSENTITNPPAEAFEFTSNKPRMYPFGWHLIENNTITGMDGTNAFDFGAQIQETTIRNNTFQGCNQTTSDIDLKTVSTNLTIENNEFYGLTAQNAFTGSNIPAGNSIAQYQSNNSFEADCTLSVDDNVMLKTTSIYPNPISSGTILNISTINDLKELKTEVYMLSGKLIYRGFGTTISTKDFASGIYILKVKTDTLEETHKFIIE